ncbi:MAG: lysine--tRNA ligase [Verrucomicrobiota bacterium]|nr:lysine--tRNA ligase [Verrucomicrobiota bacterium]
MSNIDNQESVYSDENEIIRQRVQKIEFWKEQNISPFGRRSKEILTAESVKDNFDEDAQIPAIVKVAGRIMAVRKMGKSIFADLRDDSDKIQLYVGKKSAGEDLFSLFKKLDIGDIISVSGEVFKTRMGEITIKLKEFELLSKSLRPLPEKFHGLTDVEQRYRQRYIDLIANEEVKNTFRARAAIISEIRRFMEDSGYMEVETPMLQPIAGGAQARPFLTHYNALDSKMYMRIAPELYLKKLLVGGFPKVFELNKNFRNEGLSRKHNPEFTVLEAYEAFGDCETMMDLITGIICTAAEKVTGSLQVKGEGGETINLSAPWRRVAYHDLICEYMGNDWNELDKAQKLAKADELGVHVSDVMTETQITHEIYDKHIEGRLIQPTFVTRLPRYLVPLAKACDDDSSLVDVYELVINGQELAPGYSELNDPIEQRKRFEEQMNVSEGTETEESGKIDEDFLTALEYGMPPAGGMGIGIDRLVMLLTGSESIRDVILFPQMRQINS